MKFILKIILIIFIFSNQNLLAEQKIVFINIDKIINESNRGKKLNDDLNKKYKKENEELITAKKKIEEKEKDITKQKNILSEEELNKKIVELRKIINDHNNKKRSIDIKFRDQKVKQTNELVQILNSIMAKYAEENSISFILQKKILL